MPTVELAKDKVEGIVSNIVGILRQLRREFKR
jgi:hypothetical protein